MRAGELRHRIVIQHVTEIQDSFGAAVETWSTFATLWAAVEPLSGKEFFSADVANAKVNHRIRIRHRPGIAEKMRIKWGARLFDIKAVLNLQERGVEDHLMCEELKGNA